MNSCSLKTGVHSLSFLKPLIFYKDEFSLVTDFFCFSIPAIFTVHSFSIQGLLIAKADYFCPDQPDLFSFKISNHIIVLWFIISAVLFGASAVERYWSIRYTLLYQVLLLLHHTSATGTSLLEFYVTFKLYSLPDSIKSYCEISVL